MLLIIKCIMLPGFQLKVDCQRGSDLTGYKRPMNSPNLNPEYEKPVIHAACKNVGAFCKPKRDSLMVNMPTAVIIFTPYIAHFLHLLYPTQRSLVSDTHFCTSYLLIQVPTVALSSCSSSCYKRWMATVSCWSTKLQTCPYIACDHTYICMAS
jgi:hypothetical protein